MKKFGLILGSVVVAALAFSACSTPQAPSSGNGSLATQTSVVPNTGLSTQTPAATSTGSANGGSTVGTSTPAATTGAVMATDTPAASTGGAAQNTSTPAATMTSQSSSGAAQNTATPEATMTSQSSGSTAQNTATPAATTGSTAGNTNTAQNQLVPLSQFLNLTVQGSDKQTAGKVAGVIVNTTPTNVASGQLSAILNVPNVRYVVVDVSQNAAASSSSSNGSGNFVMVPIDAFDMTAYSNSVKNNQSTASVTVLPLKVSAAAVATAPRFSLQSPPDMTASNWDANVSQYWASQGLQIPATGPQNNSSNNNSGTSSTAPNSTFMLTAPFTGLTVTGPNSTTLGQVRDFLMDPQTGKVMYAIVATAQDEAKIYAVPMNLFGWQSAASSPNTAAVVNGFVTNLPATALGAAPSASSINAFLNGGWQTTVNQYWSAFNGMNK